MTKKEIMKLIFSLNLSTKKEADLYAGRGVGMNIIKEGVNSLKGKIDIESKENSYTRIKIGLPI